MRSRAVGAIAAQAAQALASFVLQVVVARMLGLEAFGVFAILFGLVVLASGLVTGFVGDSLVVLDRRRDPIRSALQQAALLAVAACAVIAAVAAASTGLTTPAESVLLALVIGAFCLEELVRRLLMAHLRFWRVAVIDLSGLAVSGAVLGTAAVLQALTLSAVLGALVLGQVAALALGIALLPGEERRLAPLRGGDRGAVLRYGVWRALQQTLRPAMLTAVRTLVGATAGLAATGALESGRVYTAPALLAVSGLSSYFFASFARDGGAAGRIRRADRGVAAMLLLTALAGVAAVALLPVAGPLLFGRAPGVVAVLGWLLYTAAVAATTPYGALAATSGRQSVVFAVRATDTAVSVALVLVLVLLGGEAAWAPTLLAAGALGGGLTLRFLVVPRAVRPSVDRRTPARTA